MPPNIFSGYVTDYLERPRLKMKESLKTSFNLFNKDHQTFNEVHGGNTEVNNTSVVSFVLLLDTVKDEFIAVVNLDTLLAPSGDVQTLDWHSILLPHHNRVRVHSVHSIYSVDITLPLEWLW